MSERLYILPAAAFHDEHIFSAGFFLAVMPAGFLQRRLIRILIPLGQLLADRQAAVPQRVIQVIQGAHQPVRSFIDDGRARLFLQLFQDDGPLLFVKWEKCLKAEPSCGKS